MFSINLLVVYRESVNLIDYITRIKGNKMKTVLRKGCWAKKLVNRFICAENA